ncbi:4Fe-4S dicluster domain-containing protein [Methylocystis sp. MJC1]|jgi:ferredoxin|uniref:4Fe-4S dicluster domain-containing protein n=1 Tax=Methylocystis sp. MJC1 TaxID=2654282 RepID=UPI0013EBF05E|nr:4Fe-4S dicluster domain-containing protein [Methylocystis sp. MJC1]KAF2991004.1 Anaerobic sulfite reductase subunit A [Methylocystis sp. MJC1]MBU6526076.1 4Fe-4S dicluster domain-containing protein [Methylocystis sp. MJC1]UZX12538.1 4Fe-4S dicluster domain-containing protein [Methylocystis sp. MJC1]
MSEAASGAIPERSVISVDGLGALIEALRLRGRRVVAPTIGDDAIIYDEIDSLDDLPRGVTDEQEPGRYKLAQREDGVFFGYAVGPHSWKKFLHKPLLNLWRAKRQGSAIEVEAEPLDPQNYAFLGVRACELNAIAIQDRVLMGGDYVDPHYKAQREGAFIVALNCSKAGGTCFCVSMKTGPKVTNGFDLALTELMSAHAHEFLVEAGSPAGAEILAELPRRPATQQDLDAANAIIAQTAASMGRRMPDEDLPALLMRNLQHPRWQEVAQRCLSCANCTMVCPTCFCTSVEDHNDLAGVESSRSRRWDSCFTMDYSYIHGGSVRPSVSSRYRQWMTHKLATWHEQFGTTGCVGCGRCITWCPVGIDITEETQAIFDSEKSARNP